MWVAIHFVLSGTNIWIAVLIHNIAITKIKTITFGHESIIIVIVIFVNRKDAKNYKYGLPPHDQINIFEYRRDNNK